MAHDVDQSELSRSDVYQSVVRPLLFSGIKADPERLHNYVMGSFRWMNHHPNNSLVKALLSQFNTTCTLTDDRLSQSLWGISFANPMGLAAGFDKNGEAGGIWSSLGFGYAELGTVTQVAQPGNPKPRLFRLPRDRAAINRMGFNNRGAAALADQLQQTRSHHPSLIPLGVNLGKSKVTPLDSAAADYQASFRCLKALGDYFVVNVSSPNTPGLRSLQSTDQLNSILSALQDDNQGEKPLLVKIAPDLDWEAIANIITLAQTHQLAGIIATNTTIQRDSLNTRILYPTGNRVEAEAGGLSGAPLRQRSTDIIRFIYRQTQGQLPIIGVGGIFTADDAWEKITAGASLLQTYTGWIYQGPQMVKYVLEGLLSQLHDHQLSHISEAVGIRAGDSSAVA
ncbi:MAG: quinone-dependent dihydroorotate dehydrogenase [Elainellaceae cyanobacterium]